MDSTAMLLQGALLYVLAPVWLLAGFADYCWHRRLAIEDSAGLKESVLHLLLLGELGAALLAALLFEIDAALMVFLAGACLAHELTAWWDLAYAASRRPIPVPEQWIHGIQQMTPWVGLAALLILNPSQTLALLGLGDQAPDWGLHPKPLPLAPGALAILAGAGLVLVLLPFLEEFRRCLGRRPLFRPPLS